MLNKLICIQAPNQPSTGEVIELDFSVTFQSIDGFGSSFTDAAGINLASLPEQARQHLLESYFSAESILLKCFYQNFMHFQLFSEGIRFTLTRTNIGSCDFSTRNYSYNDQPEDFELQNFALAEEDLKYKVGFIKFTLFHSWI